MTEALSTFPRGSPHQEPSAGLSPVSTALPHQLCVPHQLCHLYVPSPWRKNPPEFAAVLSGLSITWDRFLGLCALVLSTCLPTSSHPTPAPPSAFLIVLRHAAPLVQPLPSWQHLTRQTGVNLGLLSRDMPLAGEGRGFLELARVLSAEVFAPTRLGSKRRFSDMCSWQMTGLSIRLLSGGTLGAFVS